MELSLTITKYKDRNFPVVMRGNLNESIKKAAEMRYDAVEIHLADPKSLDCEEIISECNRNNIKVSTIGTGLAYIQDKLSFTNTDEEIRQKAVERIHEFIDIAKRLNAKVIIGSIRGKLHENESLKYERYALDCLRKCLIEAEEKNVKLLLEAINRYETNFLNNAEETMQLINRIGSRYLELHLDTFHMNIEENNFVETIKEAGKFIGHIHIADSNRKYPGCGHIDFEEFFNALKSIDYKGAVAVECLPEPSEQEAALKTISNIKPLI